MTAITFCFQPFTRSFKYPHRLLLLRLRVLQDDAACAIYRHVVLLQPQQHRLAEQHRHHQRLPHRRPRDAVQFVFMLKVVQVSYHADTVPVADAQAHLWTWRCNGLQSQCVLCVAPTFAISLNSNLLDCLIDIHNI